MNSAIRNILLTTLDGSKYTETPLIIYFYFSEQLWFFICTHLQWLNNKHPGPNKQNSIFLVEKQIIIVIKKSP